MKLRHIVPVLLACLGGTAGAFDPSAQQESSSAALPKIELTPQLLHQFLVAEMAGHRGQLALSIGIYTDLARTTRDPRIAKRAAEIALFGRQYDAALEAARLWVENDPNSQAGRQMLAGLLAAGGRTDELTAQVAQMLATAGADLAPALLRLNRIFARSTEKRAVQKLVNEVTAPYLGFAEAHFARSVAAFEAKDIDVARHEIQRAIDIKPDWEQAALVRAQLAPRGAEAIEGLQSFVEANPKAKEARLAYARALVGEKRYEEARKEFNALLADNPQSGDVMYAVAVLSLQLNDPALAEGYLKKLVDMGYAEADSARLYLGQIAEEKKQREEALKWYGQVGGGDQYLAAQMRIANVLAADGRIEDALRGLREAKAGTPRERTQLILGQAHLLRESGRFADAFAVLDQALGDQPDQPDLLYEAALAAEKVGKVDVLDRLLRRLIEIKPDHAHAYNALGYSYVDRGQRLEEAARLIDKALELSPEDPFILDSKGWLLFRRGDANGALDLLRKALSLRADPEIAAHCGEVLWALGRRDEALKTWNEAAQANPRNEVLAATIKRFQP